MRSRDGNPGLHGRGIGPLSLQESLLRQCPGDHRRALGHPPAGRPEGLRGEAIILLDEIDYRLRAVGIIPVRVADGKDAVRNAALCHLAELPGDVHTGDAGSRMVKQ